MKKIAQLALDVHMKHSVLGEMDSNGNFRGNQSFQTAERNIIEMTLPNSPPVDQLLTG